MKYLARSLWILALTTWLLLGLGLYHQLPRDLGPIVASFHLRPNEDVIGFLNDSHSFVTAENDAAGITTAVRRRSAADGAVEATMTYDGLNIPAGADYSFLLERGLHLRSSGNPDKDPEGRVFVLDLATGQWKTFTDLGYGTQVHSNGKWALFRRPPWWRVDPAASLIDLETGRRLFDSRTALRDRQEMAAWHAFFVGDDELAVPVAPYRPFPDRVEQRPLAAPTALELWSISSGKRLRRFEGLQVGDRPAVSKDRNVAWYAWHGATPRYTTEVLDLSTGQELLSIPPDEARIPGPGGLIDPPSFSPDGRRLLSPVAGGLFDVATGACVWRAGRHETIIDHDALGRFEVKEKWSANLWGWRPEQSTYAVRSFADGAFLYRTWKSTLATFASSRDGKLLYADDKLHELPPRVNWPFLLFCQSVLALPLLVLWDVLRRRRIRRLPRAEAAP